jgi:hypothetical protein
MERQVTAQPREGVLVLMMMIKEVEQQDSHPSIAVH